MGKTVDARVTTTAELDWDGIKAPSQAAFEVLAQAAFDRLPEEFRALCSDVIFNVTEFPEDDVLKELKRSARKAARSPPSTPTRRANAMPASSRRWRPKPVSQPSA